MYLSVFYVHIKLCTKQVSSQTHMMVSGKLLIFFQMHGPVYYIQNIYNVVS